LRGFAFGVLLGFFGTIIVGGLAGLLVISAGMRPLLVCLIELGGFAGMILIAIRLDRKGFAQGIVVGGALAFLLCAICWGTFDPWWKPQAPRGHTPTPTHGR